MSMQNVDTALACLVEIAAHFSLPAEMSQLERAYIVDENGVDTTTLLKAAKELGLKARLFPGVTIERLRRMPRPLVCRLQNGNFVVVQGLDEEKAALFDPASEHPRYLTPMANFEQLFTGDVILFAKHFSVESLTRKVEAFGFRWFLPVVSKYKKFLLRVLFISLIMQMFGLLTPLFTQTIIDRVLTHHSTSTMDVLIIGMILVQIFQYWMEALRSYLFINTTNKIDVTLSAHLFKKITELPAKFFDKWQVGEIVARMGQVETIRQFLTGQALTVVLDIVFSVVYLTVMFIYSSTLSYIVWATIPLYVVLNALVAPIYRLRINEQFLLGAEASAFTVEAVTGVRTVKTMGVEQTFVERYEAVLARLLKSTLSLLNLSNVTQCISIFLSLIFDVAILWIGAYYVMQKALTVGELIAFRMMAGLVIGPILRLVNQWQAFQQLWVAMDRLGDIMDEKSEPAFDPNRTTLPSLRGEIVFDNVSFRYNADGKNVLTDIKLRIPPGARVGLVGRSGSGKSTIAKLIQRLYVPDSGRILIDGVDIAQVETAWLRRQIGVVLQENFLFAGTIRENIAIMKPSVDEATVERAAKLSGTDEFVQEIPQKYEAFVGERGSLLSGGQKQRVAIARALLLDPRILIFDEATSALDTESERLILKNIGQIAAGRTTLMIAHRLSTVKDCDVILAMDKGKIVEYGTHQQLLENKGYYYHLYASQED